jgi:predicted outer membrane protein
MWRPLAWLLAAFLVMPVASLAAEPPDPTSQTAKALATEPFMRHAAAAIKFQSASSQLALRKTKADTVQAFAHQMALDSSVAGMKFRQLLADAKLPVPRDPLTGGHKVLFDELTHSPPGKPFAKAYVEAQSTALKEDLEVFEAYARSGDDVRLKHFAEEMVPLLRGQIDQLGKLRR